MLTKKSFHNIGYDELVRSRFNLIIVYHYSKSVRDFCLTSNEQYFRYIRARTSCIQWNDHDVRFVLDQHNWIFIWLALWNNSLLVDMSLQHIHIIMIPRSNLVSGEVANSSVIVFGLVRPWPEPTIYNMYFTILYKKFKDTKRLINKSTNTAYKTKISSSCSSSGTRRVAVV